MSWFKNHDIPRALRVRPGLMHDKRFLTPAGFEMTAYECGFQNYMGEGASSHHPYLLHREPSDLGNRPVIKTFLFHCAGGFDCFLLYSLLQSLLQSLL